MKQPDAMKPLTKEARAAAWQNLGTLSALAGTARQLAQSDREYTTASLLTDIAAMEAILKRLRQAVDPSVQMTGRG